MWSCWKRWWSDKFQVTGCELQVSNLKPVTCDLEPVT
jgi:hypothetical protein